MNVLWKSATFKSDHLLPPKSLPPPVFPAQAACQGETTASTKCLSKQFPGERLLLVEL